MSRAVARGLAWSSAGSLVSALVLLGYTSVTARLVAPDAFGRYALAQTVIALFGQVANSGLATCLLRADRLDRGLLRATAAAAALTGAAACAVVEGTAAAATAYMDAQTLGLLRLLGAQLLLQPGAGVVLAALRRAGRPRAAALLETGASTGGCAVALTLLAAGWRPWGLAVAAPAGALLTLGAGLALLARVRPPHGPWVPVRQLLGHGGFFAGYGLVQSATNNAPLWCAGWLLGPAATGQLSRAWLACGIPLTALTQGLQRGAAPVLAEARGANAGQLPGAAVYDLMCAASALSFLGFGALAAAGPDALRLLLGPGWEPAAALVPVLALGAACALLCSTGNSLDQIRRAPRASLATQAAVIIGTGLALAAAWRTHDLTVLALAATAPALGHALQLRRWHRSSVLPVRPLLAAHGAHAALGLALYTAGRAAADGHPPLAAALTSTLAVTLAAAACWPLRTRIPAGRVALRRGLLPPPRRKEKTACTSP
ncbi:oligosaccharide flippase family protein [Actinomycetota bacterium Odt1-20B]